MDFLFPKLILSGPKETWVKVHSVFVTPPSISHPTLYPKPLYPGPGFVSVPPAPDSYTCCSLGSWLLLACCFFLGQLLPPSPYSPLRFLFSQGLFQDWTLPDASGRSFPYIHNKTLLNQTQEHSCLLLFRYLSILFHPSMA